MTSFFIRSPVSRSEDKRLGWFLGFDSGIDAQTLMARLETYHAGQIAMNAFRSCVNNEENEGTALAMMCTDLTEMITVYVEDHEYEPRLKQWARWTLCATNWCLSMPRISLQASWAEHEDVHRVRLEEYMDAMRRPAFEEMIKTFTKDFGLELQFNGWCSPHFWRNILDEDRRPCHNMVQLSAYIVLPIANDWEPSARPTEDERQSFLPALSRLRLDSSILNGGRVGIENWSRNYTYPTRKSLGEPLNQLDRAFK